MFLLMKVLQRRSLPFVNAREFQAISTVFVVSLILASCAFAQDDKQSGFDVTQLDRSADPCVDFYQFACGGWRAKNPLPAD
jgi:hypothetical protein